MEFAGIRPSAVADFVDREYSRQVSVLVNSARKEGVYIRDKAEGIASERWVRVRRAFDNHSFRNHAFAFALDLYRKGWIPSALVGRLAWKYFQRRIEGRL